MAGYRRGRVVRGAPEEWAWCVRACESECECACAFECACVCLVVLVAGGREGGRVGGTSISTTSRWPKLAAYINAVELRTQHMQTQTNS